MADEPRRSVRATKGQHTKSLDLLDQPAEPKKRGTKKSTAKKVEEEEPQEEEEEIIRCICGVTEQDDESDEDWIACEQCSAWQHNVCMGVTTDKAVLDTLEYYCEQCKPEDHKELLEGMARGEKLWEQRRRAHEEAEREASKSKRGRKGKGKKSLGPELEIEANVPSTKPAPVEAPVEVKKEKDKKDTPGRAASTKRKAKDDPVEETPKAKTRKVSIADAPQSKATHAPPPSGPPADIPSTIVELADKTREGVTRLIQKNLAYALKQGHESGTFAGSETEVEQKATRLALEIERAVHDNFDQTAYATQGRRVGTNLKINLELSERLLSGSLTPSALAVMTDEELATKELQRQTAEMKARAEKQAIMVTEEGPRIRRTHKGEEVVETTTSAAAADELPTVARRRSMLDPNADMGARSRENSPAGDQVELPQDIDDYRSQDDIRAAAAPKQPLAIDTSGTKISPPLRKASTQTNDFDINKVFSSVKSPTVSQHNRKPSGPVPPPREGPGHDPEIDKMLEDGNESPPYSPREYEADPSIVWRGSLLMNSIADFPAVARHIGGADLSQVGPHHTPWNDLIPQRLQVAGRIDHEKANQYLCGLRYSTVTDVVVLALTPAGPAATTEFTKLYNYFHSKGRYGVVGNKGLANVRDTYLVPVPPGSGNIPEFLLNLENNQLPENRPEPIVLVTLVIRHDMQPQQSLDPNASPSTPALITHPQRQMSIGGYGGPGMSPIQAQGSFGSPMTPFAGNGTSHQPENQNLTAEQVRFEAQQRGEALARSILGEFITAPTVSFLLPQAFQMKATEWEVIRTLYREDPKAQEDLGYLSQLIEKKGVADKPAS